MMDNEHVELVKKWLDNPESVSKEDLEANARDAADACNVAYAAVCSAAAYAQAKSDKRDYVADDSDAAYWVKKYEELNNEK